ncbi:MAG: hypothetical protein QNJ47_12770 [Nostocaceae cyanobacterium]|nr:hypothetical protein [Nostocaceae cyanobacterium]
MAIIKIDDLNNFDDEKNTVSGSFLKDLQTKDSRLVYGGKGNDFSLLLNYTFAGLAIHSIRRIADSFME